MGIQGAENTLEKVRRDLDALLPRSASNAAVISVNAGGVGIWICAFFSVITFLMFCVMLVLFVNHDRKIDDLNHIVSAIYMVAPELNQRNSDGNSDHRDPASSATPAEPLPAAD